MLTLPLTMVFIVIFVFGLDQDAILYKPIIHVGESTLNTVDCVFLSYYFNQMLDGLITLIVVKPYRSAAIEIFRNLKQKFIWGATSTSAVTVMRIGGNRAS